MQNNNPMTFTLIIVALILGWVLYKDFDFKTFSFEKPAMAAIYGTVFIVSLFVLIKNKIQKRER